jgi:hypothetical protein
MPCRCALSLGLLRALMLLAAAPEGSSAKPWRVGFGGCSFSGDSDGAPLARAGACEQQVSLHAIVGLSTCNCSYLYVRYLP